MLVDPVTMATLPANARGAIGFVAVIFINDCSEAEPVTRRTGVRLRGAFSVVATAEGNASRL
jgi:hypothetical protein